MASEEVETGNANANGSVARFSNDGRYRYLLTRRTGFSERAVTFLMLNPSTADAVQDDPTIRRCVGFANAWGFGWLHVVNLSPLRATDPKELLAAGPEPEDVWEENLQTILYTAASSDLVVAAYGNHGSAEGRCERVLEALEAVVEVHCLGATKQGHPRHPLYLSAQVAPERFHQPTPTPTEDL